MESTTTDETKKYKNVGANLLRFSLGETDYAVRPGGTVTLPAGPYVDGLVLSGVLVEKPAPASQIELNLSSDAGTTQKTEAGKTAPATTAKATKANAGTLAGN